MVSTSLTIYCLPVFAYYLTVNVKKTILAALKAKPIG